MEKLRLFAVSSIRKPPMELSRKRDQPLFKCTLTLPIAPQLLIFHQGDWPLGEDKNVTLDIYINSEKIGEMDEDTKCFAWEAGHMESRPTGEQIVLEIKMLGLKTPTEQIQAPKTRKGPVQKRTDKAPPPQEQKKACEKDAPEKALQPTGDVSKKLKAPKTDSEKTVAETVTPKSPEKSKGTKSSTKDISSGSGKDKREEKKKKNLALPATKDKKKSIPPTTGVKKTRQTQLNFSGAKVSSAPETQKKEVEQDKIKNKTILKVKTAGNKVCTTKAAELHHTEQQSKGTSPMETENRAAKKAELHHTEQQSKGISPMETENRAAKKAELHHTEQQSKGTSPMETENRAAKKAELHHTEQQSKGTSPMETENRAAKKAELHHTEQQSKGTLPMETENRAGKKTELHHTEQQSKGTLPMETKNRAAKKTELHHTEQQSKGTLPMETKNRAGKKTELHHTEQQSKGTLPMETENRAAKKTELHHTEQQSKGTSPMETKNRAAKKTVKRSLMGTEKRSAKKTEKMPMIKADKISPVETEKRSTIKTDKISSVETEKRSTIKTGKISPVETEKRTTIKTMKISPVETEKNTMIKTRKISPEMTEEMLVMNMGETGLDEDGPCETQVLNENTPQMAADMPSPLPRKPMKKRLRSDMDKSQDGPTPKKRGTRMRAQQSEGTPNSSRAKIIFTSDSPFKENLTPVKPEKPMVLSDGQLTRCIDLSARVPQPSARWGHTMQLARPHCAVLIGGQGERQQLSKDSIWTLNTDTRNWQCEEVQSEGQKPENRMGHTATYDPTMRCIYIFGGSKNSRWFHDVHVYDLDEDKWTLAKVEGKAPTRAYHTTNIHRHELWVFGGVYPRPDPNPDGCSNELHIYSPVMQTWYTPLVQGEKPLPRSGHSATLIGDQMVMFGGWDAPFCYNDLFILDHTTVDWSKPDVKGAPPKPRSWHASSALSGQRILIHGGYDGNEALHDSYIFDLEGLSWSHLVVPNNPKARAGHTAVCLPYTHESKEEDEVLVFGGGDNDGEFFSDLLSLAIPFTPVVELQQE